MKPLQHPAFTFSDIRPSEKMLLAAQVYHGVAHYFGHWEGAPEFDLDKEYGEFLEKIADTDARLDLHFALLEFLAKLNNGHTWTVDMKIAAQFPPNFGLKVYKIDNSWIVIESVHKSCPPGAKVLRVDESPLEEYYSQARKYIFASSDRGRRARLWFTPVLFPDEFTITFEIDDHGTQKERTLTINQKDIKANQLFFTQKAPLQKMVGKKDIPYLKIPNFGDPDNEAAAIQFVTDHTDAPALIFDIRGNTGGSTPMRLARSLMNCPYRWFSEKAPMTPVLHEYYYNYYDGQIRNINGQENQKEKFEDLIEGRDQSELAHHSSLMWQSSWYPAVPGAYKGRVAILVDRRTGSSAEDFTFLCQVAKRAIIIGETTNGSTGQPYMFQSESGVALMFGMKRAYYPDGRPFEGAGICPDILVPWSRPALEQGVDEALEKAIEICTK